MLFSTRRELLDRFRAADRAALEDVYRAYVPVVSSFLARGFAFKSGERTLRFRGFSQPFDLDNALSETFARAFKESARLGYDGVSSYQNYILAIARNFVIDQLRSREVLASTLVAASDELDIDPALQLADGAARREGREVSQEDTLLARELGELCSSFVQGLGERDRSFFHARFVEGRGQVDAGRVVALSHMQARTLEKKLRARFLEFMQQSGYFEGYSGARQVARAR